MIDNDKMRKEKGVEEGEKFKILGTLQGPALASLGYSSAKLPFLIFFYN